MNKMVVSWFARASYMFQLQPSRRTRGYALLVHVDDYDPAAITAADAKGRRTPAGIQA